MHSQSVANYLRANYFRGALGAASAEAVKDHLEGRDPLPAEKVEELRTIVRERQIRVGYIADYRTWLDAHTPGDLGNSQAECHCTCFGSAIFGTGVQPHKAQLCQVVQPLKKLIPTLIAIPRRGIRFKFTLRKLARHVLYQGLFFCQ